MAPWTSPTGNDEIDRYFRNWLWQRYADLAQQHKAKTAQLADLATRGHEPEDDLTILEQLPTTKGAQLADVHEKLLRDLYENFNLELRYRTSAPSTQPFPTGPGAPCPA